MTTSTKSTTSTTSHSRYLKFLQNVGFENITTPEPNSSLFKRCVHISAFNRPSTTPNTNKIEPIPSLSTLSEIWTSRISESFSSKPHLLSLPPPFQLFFTLPYSLSISTNTLYQQGILFSLDPCSLAPIIALQPNPNDNILDICGSPGTKSILLAEHCKTITNVDISPERQNLTRNQFLKYSISNGRIYVRDARKFDILAPGDQYLLPSSFPHYPKYKGNPIWGYSTTSTNNTTNSKKQLKRPCDEPRGKVARKRWQKWRANLDGLVWCGSQSNDSSAHLYSKILVDVECSTDSAPSYLFNYSENSPASGVSDSASLILDKIENGSFQDLQTSILSQAFTLLAPGGILCYSTCSLDPNQDELVVLDLLTKNKNSKYIPCPSLGSLDSFLVSPNPDRWVNIKTMTIDSIDFPLKKLQIGSFLHSGRKGIYLALIKKTE